MSLRRILCLIACFFCAAAFSHGALAADKIGAIRVEGNQRIESATIISYLGVSSGEDYSQESIDKGLKAIFATGFFADAKIYRTGPDIIIRVKENPLINKVTFEGNKGLSTDDLQKEIQLKARSVFSTAKVQADVKRLLDLYRRSGRYSASVEPKAVPQDQNRIDVIYEITEGPVAQVQKITFVGNDKVGSDVLVRAIRTSESRWYKFYSDDDKYDPDRLAYDQELLRRYYVSQGYADFQVKSAYAEMSPAKDAFFLTFVVEEGPQYTVRKVIVDNTLKSTKKPDLLPLSQVKAGEVYDASVVEDSVDAMTKELGNLGYAFVDIKPKLERIHEKGRNELDVTYSIKPGPRVYVEKINVTGNVRTLDEVVRREFRLAEGDPYNAAKLKRSEERLKNLNFFENVEIKSEPGSAPDKTVINTKVTEKSTGEINLGAGFSSTDGALADIGFKEANFLGRGQELRARLTYAARRKQGELGFTEPYFLGREVAAGFDLFRSTSQLTQNSTYDFDMKGLKLRGSYALQEHWQHSFNYFLRENNITNVSTNASAYIQKQAGTNITSSIGQAFTFDERDSRTAPTNGEYLTLSQELAGFGGDSRYLKHEVKGSYYTPLAKKWILSFIGSAGHAIGLGQKVRINDRYFIGGNEIRGFSNVGVGPRDNATRDALGGNTYYAFTTETRFPLGLPDELGFTGAAFMDVGSLFNAQEKGTGISDDSSPRVSAGIGFAWTSPFGPIRLDIAKPIVKQKYDDTELLRINFGTRF